MRIMVLPITVLITLCGCTDQAEVERQAVAAIQQLGGVVGIEDGKVVGVALIGSRIDDTELARLKVLTEVRTLTVGGPGVTDAGLVHLSVLPGLRSLVLTGTQVTAEGVTQLKQALPNLEVRNAP